MPEEPALAVQIENHPEARPGRNISKAEIVVETLVEGDTTRFTAIFLCEPTLGMTGPVRSARYHNIDLWQDIHVLTVGFGASPGAVERFINAGMPYPNGIDGGWPWYARYGLAQAPAQPLCRPRGDARRSRCARRGSRPSPIASNRCARRGHSTRSRSSPAAAR